MKTLREYVMMPGLNRSLAARAAASSVARSSFEQAISWMAASREMGLPGQTVARVAAQFLGTEGVIVDTGTLHE